MSSPSPEVIDSPAPEVSARTARSGSALLALSVATTGVAFATCLVRFLIRYRIRGQEGWDDFAVAGGMLVGLVGAIFAILESLSLSDEMAALQFDFLAQPWLSMALALSHISICLFFFRIVGKTRPWNMLLTIIIISLAIVNLVNTLTANLQCRPLEKLWNPAVLGVCWDPNIQLGIGYGQSAFAIFTDFFLALFPVMIVREIELQTNQRWPFYTLSFLSLAAGVCAIVRTYEISIVGAAQGYSYEMLVAQILAILEMNLGIISSNVLPLGPLNARERKQSFSLRSKLPKDLESSYIDTTVFRSVKSQEGRGASRDSNKDTTQLIAGSRERVADVPIDEPGVPLLRLPSAMSRNASPTGLSRNASPAGRPGTSDLTASADRKTGSVKAAREAIRASAAVQSGQGQQNYGTRPSTSRTDGGDNASGNRESNMWGIWKTVIVQVVNEDAVPGETITVVQGPNKGPRISKVEQQWEGMLRGR